LDEEMTALTERSNELEAKSQANAEAM